MKRPTSGLGMKRHIGHQAYRRTLIKTELIALDFIAKAKAGVLKSEYVNEVFEKAKLKPYQQAGILITLSRYM